MVNYSCNIERYKRTTSFQTMLLLVNLCEFFLLLILMIIIYQTS